MRAKESLSRTYGARIADRCNYWFKKSSKALNKNMLILVTKQAKICNLANLNKLLAFVELQIQSQPVNGNRMLLQVTMASLSGYLRIPISTKIWTT